MLGPRLPLHRRFHKCLPFLDAHSECGCAEALAAQTVVRNVDIDTGDFRFPYGARMLIADHATCDRLGIGNSEAPSDYACPELSYAVWHAAGSRSALAGLRQNRRSCHTSHRNAHLCV